MDIHDCMVLEDSHNGIRAGHASGAETVMVPDLLPCLLYTSRCV